MIKNIHTEDFYDYVYRNISLYQKNLLVGLLRDARSISNVVATKKINYIEIKIYNI